MVLFRKGGGGCGVTEHLLLSTQHAHSGSSEALAAQYRAHCERRAAYTGRKQETLPARGAAASSNPPHKPAISLTYAPASTPRARAARIGCLSKDHYSKPQSCRIRPVTCHVKGRCTAASCKCMRVLAATIGAIPRKKFLCCMDCRFSSGSESSNRLENILVP